MRALHARTGLIALALFGAGLTIALVLAGLSQNVTYFYAPADIKKAEGELLANGKRIRLGGMVEEGSVKRDGLKLSFRVTDYQHTVAVSYEGIVPDLFREGQGVVAEGVLSAPDTFKAATLLAKHDENYMPPEVAKALRKSETGNQKPETK